MYLCEATRVPEDDVLVTPLQVKHQEEEVEEVDLESYFCFQMSHCVQSAEIG